MTDTWVVWREGSVGLVPVLSGDRRLNITCALVPVNLSATHVCSVTLLGKLDWRSLGNFWAPCGQHRP